MKHLIQAFLSQNPLLSTALIFLIAPAVVGFLAGFTWHLASSYTLVRR